MSSAKLQDSKPSSQDCGEPSCPLPQPSQVCQLPLRALLGHLVLPYLGRIPVMGTSRKGRQGAWDNKRSLMRCPLGPRALCCTLGRCRCHEICLFWILCSIDTHPRAAKLTKGAVPIPPTQVNPLLWSLTLISEPEQHRILQPTTFTLSLPPPSLLLIPRASKKWNHWPGNIVRQLQAMYL